MRSKISPKSHCGLKNWPIRKSKQLKIKRKPIAKLKKKLKPLLLPKQLQRTQLLIKENHHLLLKYQCLLDQFLALQNLKQLRVPQLPKQQNKRLQRLHWSRWTMNQEIGTLNIMRESFLKWRLAAQVLAVFWLLWYIKLRNKMNRFRKDKLIDKLWQISLTKCSKKLHLSQQRSPQISNTFSLNQNWLHPCRMPILRLTKPFLKATTK